MAGIEIILSVLVALTVMLTVIVVYKMAMKQKNINLIKEELKKKRQEDMKGGAEFTAGASGLGAAETVAPVPKSDQHFHPSR